MTLYEMNKKSIEWWNKYCNSANDWFEKEVGDIINASIYDIFPNLRCFKNGCEFEIIDKKSFTSGIIEVSICTVTGLLIIEDGHHRFNEAILDGHNRVDVKVICKKQSDRTLLKII